MKREKEEEEEESEERRLGRARSERLRGY